ncbi:MAG: response regulator transcription factor [Thermoleophilia bacterium]|nr:response regulator transcription factor [Thermoleophilia bacterium]
MSKRILVVDDEPGIVDLVSYGLRREGYDVESASDGERALSRAREDTFDLIVLDVMLPRMSGMDVCRTLRGESDVPILMLTARDAEVDTVVGLEVGADDYVTKPFSMAELTSRVRALLRRRELDRAAAGAGVVREAGGIRVDLVRHEVTVDGAPVTLTPSEYRLLTLLMNEPQRVFTRRQIMQHLWDSAWVADERTCDAHVSNLRRKLGSAADRIATVRGVGYKLA